MRPHDNQLPQQGTDHSLSLTLCSLLSSSLNGSDVTTIVEGLTAPDSIAIDFVHNYMYFTDWVEDKISRVKVYTR